MAGATMKTVAVVAALMLASSAATEAQIRESLSAAANRIAREIATVGPERQQPRGKDDWGRVRGLVEGSVVRVIMRDGGLKDGHVGFTSDDRIVLVSASALPSDARGALLDVATNHPGYIGRERHFRHKKLTVEDAGIFFDGTRIAETASVLIDIERDAIAEILRPKRGSLVGGLLGVAAGAGLGLFGAAHLMFKRCGGSCGDEQALMALSLIGTPIAGAYIGAKAMPHADWTTVYRRR